MAKKIVILQASPKKDGNTASLVKWFIEGAAGDGADIKVIETAFLKYKTNGCVSCRACQVSAEYGCVINDDARPVLLQMAEADVIVMATPLYFFGPSAQLKLVFDRMFSLYKWDNETGDFSTPLTGKTLVLIASAYEDTGLDVLERPFSITAEYSGMKFRSLLVPNAGVSGGIRENTAIREKAVALGRAVA